MMPGRGWEHAAEGTLRRDDRGAATRFRELFTPTRFGYSTTRHREQALHWFRPDACPAHVHHRHIAPPCARTTRLTDLPPPWIAPDLEPCLLCSEFWLPAHDLRNTLAAASSASPGG